MLAFYIFLGVFVIVKGGPATEASYKGQFCTDPRTMRKHAAYTEWADAYSCTRHRCQPGGRNLAIYTVGCKRVEAPESAIECEEVVEDTNMQFPYCCTRLRCLVVVRGEVWTRVLGQPWETLPAAPWSHMYKMKKPPPEDGSFSPKTGEGPVYELQTEAENDGGDKVLRTGKKTTEGPDCNEGAAPVARAAPAPDIVIALSTNSEKDPPHKKSDVPRHRRGRKITNSNNYLEEEAPVEPRADDQEEPVMEKEKPVEPASDERYFANAFGVTQKAPYKVAWTEIPQNQWNEHDPNLDTEPALSPRQPNLQEPAPTSYHQPDLPPPEEKKEEKPGNLQALVDAIGTRMRDIESVVQRMSEKVHSGKPAPAPEPEFGSSERSSYFRSQDGADYKHHEGRDDREGRDGREDREGKEHSKEHGKVKKPSPDGDHYKRFTGHRGSKYLHGSGDLTTEQPLFVEDTNLNGYFSDASNSVRRSPPKEPAATYMAPVVETRRKSHSGSGEEVDKKHKKRVHKRKRKNGHHKKHHGKEDKRKRFNKMNSVELDRNVVSLEDSSGVGGSK
ncbi:uncharacterized protein LOC126378401 isoform X2 [Pectinophora gossypiella]|uniref:uncharacterized protein LOC126378401 isoform X2 n=1 Tax=Pectinophora gossypiella TaxID=13191 RepID=UPI00214EF961|nr:uncharacterized protein LOC126378401 isoform X2 [Pectinophora gossypiella]